MKDLVDAHPQSRERVTAIYDVAASVARYMPNRKTRATRRPGAFRNHNLSPFGQIARSVPFNSSYLRGNLGYDPWLLAPNTKLVLDSVGNNET